MHVPNELFVVIVRSLEQTVILVVLFRRWTDPDGFVFQAGQTVSRIIKELDEPQYTFKDIFQVLTVNLLFVVD